MHRRRWSDTDRYFGPFTYATNERAHGIAVVLNSGDDDDHPGCSLRVTLLSRTLIVSLPAIIKPWRAKVVASSWDEATVSRLGRNWYWNTYPREYGVSCAEGFFQIYLGRTTHDSSTEQRWFCFLPWTQWRHVRHSLYGLNGQPFWTQGKRARGFEGFRELQEAQDSCPSVSFEFADFDGERLSARTIIEEREWRFGKGWFKWLSLFRGPKIRRSLDIRFSGETGRRKGSWKGGTVGHSIDLLPAQLHEAAFRHYCAEHGMTFVGPVQL